MKKPMMFIFSILINGLSVAQNTDSVFYYRPNGEKEWWYLQKDVFAFRMQNGLEYTNPETDTSVVDRSYHNLNATRKSNFLEFKANTNEVQREIEREKPRNRPNFECEFLVLTKNRIAPKSEMKWVATDDIILVVFANPITASERAQFANRNDLILHHEPSNNLSPLGTWTYAFRIRTDQCGATNSVKKAKEIFENENGFVKVCSPNMKVYSPECDLSFEYNNFAEPNKLWWIENNGEEISTGNFGTVDADIDLCECWEEGYTGKEIKIGVIDYHGFEFTHQDMQGRFVTGWNTFTEAPMPTNNYGPNAATKGHGMHVSGLLAANKNTSGLIGAAYDAQIYPVLMDGEIYQISMGIQKAIENECQIINMSFGLAELIDLPLFEEVVHNDIMQGVNWGRYDPQTESYLGTIFVSTSGNGNDNVLQSDGTYSYLAGWRNYPGSWDEVIGVGNSNPFDKREFLKTSNSNLVIDGGANGGEWYEVVAPGTILMLVDLSGELGSNDNSNYTPSLDGSYYSLYGTSYAAPLVSGIIAILLEYNPQLTWQEARELIVNGAEKVHPELYDYMHYPDYPGVSNQMYYGRASCINSLNLLKLGAVNKKGDLAKLVFDSENKIFNNQSMEMTYELQLFDLGARLVKTEQVHGGTSWSLQNDLPHGMYLVQIYDQNHNFCNFVKIVL